MLASCYRKHRRIQTGYPSRLIHTGPCQGFLSPHLLIPMSSEGVSFLQHSLVNIHQSFVPPEFIPGPSAGFLSSCTHPLVFSRVCFPPDLNPWVFSRIPSPFTHSLVFSRFAFLQISILGSLAGFLPLSLITWYLAGFLSSRSHPQVFSWIPSLFTHSLVFSRFAFLQISILGSLAGFLPLSLIPKLSAGFLSSCTHSMVFSRFPFL